MKFDRTASAFLVLFFSVGLAKAGSISDRLESRSLGSEAPSEGHTSYSVQSEGPSPLEAVLQLLEHRQREAHRQRAQQRVPQTEHQEPTRLTPGNLRTHELTHSAQPTTEWAPGRPPPGPWHVLWADLRDAIASARQLRGNGDFRWITSELQRVQGRARAYSTVACHSNGWTPERILEAVRGHHVLASPREMDMLEAVHRVVARPSFDGHDFLHVMEEFG